MNVDFGTNDIDEILSIIKVFRSNKLFEMLVEGLTEREENVLFHRVVESRTLKYVAEVYDVTCERIRQIEAKARRKLRNHHGKMMMAIQIRLTDGICFEQ